MFFHKKYSAVFIAVVLCSTFSALANEQCGSTGDDECNSFNVKGKPSNVDDSIVNPSQKTQTMAGRNERTFLAVKPDGVQRGLVGEVLKRFEQRGYKLVAMKMVVPDEHLLTEHYKEHIGRPFFKPLLGYMSSGPVVAMVFEGTNVIKAARTMLGATKPQDSAPGTLRGDFCIDVGRNLVHGSDSLESAAREISLWFTEKEICHWTPANEKWIYE